MNIALPAAAQARAWARCSPVGLAMITPCDGGVAKSFLEAGGLGAPVADASARAAVSSGSTRPQFQTAMSGGVGAVHGADPAGADQGETIHGASVWWTAPVVAKNRPLD